MSFGIIKGPAKVTYDGEVFWSKGDVTVSHETTLTGVATDQHGPVDERVDSLVARISFVPSGRLDEAVALVYPAVSRVVGASLFGTTAKTLVIEPLNGDHPKTTFHRVACTGLPNLVLSASATMLEQVTFTALRGADDSAISSMFTTAAQGSAPALTFDPAQILMGPWTGAWRSDAVDPEDPTDYDEITTMDGWRVQFGLQTSEDKVDAAGLCDITHSGLTVQVRAMPLLTEAEIQVMLQRATVPTPARGSSLGRDFSLVLTNADGITVTLAKCGVKDAQALFGKDKARQGEVVWTAARKDGTTPLLVLGTP